MCCLLLTSAHEQDYVFKDLRRAMIVMLDKVEGDPCPPGRKQV
jgi:hypothetical protein